MELENNLVSFAITRGPIRGKDRNRIGITIKVKAHRDVEDFMRTLGGGARAGVDLNGDLWQNCGNNPNPLEYYENEQRFEAQALYTLDAIGAAPLVPNNSERLARAAGLPSAELVNLSFLRLVGISEESGVSVGIAGAYSYDYIKRLKTAMPRAVEQFLRDFVVPITINLQIISKS